MTDVNKRIEPLAPFQSNKDAIAIATGSLWSLFQGFSVTQYMKMD